MKKHAALVIATVIIVYTLAMDFRFYRTMSRILADQANPQITLPDVSSLHRPESGQFPGVVLDFAADNFVYLGGKRMSDEHLKNLLTANPGIKLRCQRAVNTLN